MQLRGSFLARAVLRLFGWRAIGPVSLPAKAVLIAYPHTSNWDFIYGILGRSALGLGARWVGKDSLFRWPAGPVMRWLGGIPVNRSQPAGFVDRVAAEFALQPRFLVAIAPEGTRKRTACWKSGFYRIALAARVPIVLGCIDYAAREVGIVGVIEPSGDAAADMACIAAAYAGRQGRHPANAAPIVFGAKV